MADCRATMLEPADVRVGLLGGSIGSTAGEVGVVFFSALPAVETTLRSTAFSSTTSFGICHGLPVLGCGMSPKSRRKKLGSLAPVIAHWRTGVARA